jgi:hypothetical protein
VASRRGDEMTGDKDLETMGRRSRCSEMRAMIGEGHPDYMRRRPRLNELYELYKS